MIMRRPVLRTITAAVFAAAAALPAPVSAAPERGFTRTGAVSLNAGQDDVYQILLDRKRGYLYAFCNVVPTQIVKLRAATETQLPAVVGTLTLPAGEGGALYDSAALDEEAGMIYLATQDLQGFVVKIAVGEGDALPTRIGSFGMEPEDAGTPLSLEIDPATGYGYAATGGGPPSRMVKFRLGEGNALPVRLGSAPFGPGEAGATTLAIDPGAGKLYAKEFLTGSLIQFSAGAGDALPVRDGAFTLAPILGTQASIIHLDLLNRLAIMGNSNPYISVADVSGALPRGVGAGYYGSLAVGPYGMGLDFANGFAFAPFSAAAPGPVLKVGLGSGSVIPAEISRAEGTAMEGIFVAAAYDARSGFFYTADTMNDPSTIVVFRQQFPATGPRLETSVTDTKVSTKGTGFVAQVRGNIANPGTEAAGEFRVRAYLSTDDTLSHDDVPIGKELRVKSLKAGKSRKFGFKSASQVGTATGRRIIVVADSLKQVDVANRATAIAASGRLP